MANIRTILVAVLGSLAVTASSQADSNPNTNTGFASEEKLVMTQEWDKTFPKSDKVNHQKVTFTNRCGITLAADMYTPKDINGKLPAIAVSGHLEP